MSRSGLFRSLSAALTAVALSAAFAAAVQTVTALPAHADGGLACDYSLIQWPGGFSANLTIANNSATTINGWTASWNFQYATAVTTTWSGTITQSSPFDATAHNMFWNAVVKPGSAVALGWNATAAVTDIPQEIDVNGIPCPVNGRT
jgi:hypothetical protein